VGSVKVPACPLCLIDDFLGNYEEDLIKRSTNVKQAKMAAKKADKVATSQQFFSAKSFLK
jgi:hypothetical protein